MVRSIIIKGGVVLIYFIAVVYVLSHDNLVQTLGIDEIAEKIAGHFAKFTASGSESGQVINLPSMEASSVGGSTNTTPGTVATPGG